MISLLMGAAGGRPGDLGRGDGGQDLLHLHGGEEGGTCWETCGSQGALEGAGLGALEMWFGSEGEASGIGTTEARARDGLHGG